MRTAMIPITTNNSTSVNRALLSHVIPPGAVWHRPASNAGVKVSLQLSAPRPREMPGHRTGGILVRPAYHRNQISLSAKIERISVAKTGRLTVGGGNDVRNGPT